MSDCKDDKSAIIWKIKKTSENLHMGIIIDTHIVQILNPHGNESIHRNLVSDEFNKLIPEIFQQISYFNDKPIKILESGDVITNLIFNNSYLESLPPPNYLITETGRYDRELLLDCEIIQNLTLSSNEADPLLFHDNIQQMKKILDNLPIQNLPFREELIHLYYDESSESVFKMTRSTAYNFALLNKYYQILTTQEKLLNDFQLEILTYCKSIKEQEENTNESSLLDYIQQLRKQADLNKDSRKKQIIDRNAFIQNFYDPSKNAENLFRMIYNISWENYQSEITTLPQIPQQLKWRMKLHYWINYQQLFLSKLQETQKRLQHGLKCINDPGCLTWSTTIRKANKTEQEAEISITTKNIKKLQNYIKNLRMNCMRKGNAL